MSKSFVDPSGPLSVHGDVSLTRESDEPPALRSLSRSALPAWAARNVGHVLLILHQTSGFGAPRRSWLRMGEQILLGRNSQCDLVLAEDLTVSGTHCRIFWDGKIPRIEDLGSTNGTWLNGQSITVADLCSGDQLRVGQAEYAVYLESVPSRPERNVQLRSDALHRLPAGKCGEPSELNATWRSPSD